MNPDDQPTIPSSPPNHTRPLASGKWQAPSVEQMQAMLPQYEILEILGRGGMGAVYKGRQKSLKRLVAIKILPPDAADDEMRFVERFENEAQTMAAMNHPAIVSVYDFGETAEGLLYFIMEFVDGTDVHKMIQTSGKLGDDYALAITAHVCDALDYAHSRGVIHRDIKPANILIDQDGRVKVADFGLAKMHDPSMTSGLTRTNMAMGTPDYVAPEALSMGMVVDHRADLYAVGVMLYQMLTGEVPRGMFRMPSEKGIGTDPRFDEIICKAMESDREHRYQTASEVRHSLDVILTTPQPKNDGTGVVPLAEMPKKVVLNVPGGPLERSAGTPAGGTAARSQGASPKNAPVKNSAGKGAPGNGAPGNGAPGNGAPGNGAPGKSARAPDGRSSTGLWVTVVGVVAAIAVAAFFVMGGRPRPAAGPAPSSASTVDAKSKENAAMAPTPRPSERPTGQTNTPPPATPGKTIDLLALVDVKRDTIAGEWVRTADGLAKQGHAPPDKGAPRLQLPYEPPEEYDFEIEFTAVSENHWVGQMMSAQSRVFSWILAGNSPEAPTAGFEMFDNGPTSRPSEAVAPMERNLEKGRRYVSRVEVRKGGLRGFLDGVKLVDWSGDPKRLSPGNTSTLRDDKHLGLRAARDVVFHKITVREITGTGKVDEGIATTSSVSANTIDLLALVDVKRDAVVGKWSHSANGLSVGAGDQTTTGKGSLRLQLPYQPPEEYDFEIEFTASAAPGRTLGHILSASARNFSLLLGAGTESQPLAGFEMLDGLSTGRQTNTTKPLPGGIESGRRYRSRVEVRRDSMRAFLDDKEVVSWKGSFSRLSTDEQTRLRDELHLGLRTIRPVTFHKITVLEITGTGKLDAGVVAASSALSSAAAAHPATPPPPGSVTPATGATKDAPFENSLGMKFVPVPDTDVLFCIHETRYRDYAEYAKMAKEGVDGGWKIQNRDGYEIKTSAGDHPVVNVNWDDAKAFCKWLSEKEGLTYRLPTDREWSLAVGIGREEDWKSDTTPATVFQVPDVYPWGKDWPPPQGAGNYSDESRRARAPRAEAMYLEGYDDGFPTTAPVMSFEPNPLGLFDLGSNVSEWCEDWYSVEQKERVLRGASWDSRGQLSSNRLPTAPGGRSNNRGFRIVLEIDASSPQPSAANPPGSPSTPDPALAPATWTDWLTPRLARSQFKKSGYVVEKDGITTDQPVTGIDLAEEKVAQGSIRLTYLLRDSQGAQIVFRNRATQEMYVADDSGSELSIARLGEGNKKTILVSEPYPATLSRTGERNLEFRVKGDALKATVNGTFSVSAEAPTLATDPGSFGAFSIRKGLLLKKVEIADSKETVGGATTAAKPDEDFIRAVAAASPEEQVSLVTAKLNEINGAQAILVPTIMGGKVKFLRVEQKGGAPPLFDISPLAALKDLTDLRLMYVGPADISCLGGLPLERLEILGGSFEDISVLKSMPLKFLILLNLPQSSQEALDFTILRGMKLKVLRLSSKPLVDISFIQGMPLYELSLTQSGVKDFSPIAGMPLVHLEFDPEAKPNIALLRSIPTLQTINKMPAAEYLK